MVVRNVVAVCLVASVCMMSPDVALKAEAVQLKNSNDSTQISEENPQRDVGLIQDINLNISNTSNMIYISASTASYDTMAKIGEIDIEVQSSSNGTNGWTIYATVPDQIATNSYIHELYNYEVSVASGYYYRVVLTHYAKETGWFFPKSQSEQDVSTVKYIY